MAGIAAAGPVPGGTLDPTSIPKYEEPLIIPPQMPQSGTKPLPGGGTADYFEIAMRQFQQYILPQAWSLANAIDPTTVWSYGSIDHPGTVAEGGTFNYPGFTIEATVDRPTRIKWINDLVDENGNYLPHLLPVDQTIHWANPAGGADMRDGHGHSQDPYTGPVPMVTHVHGAHTTDDSDGFTEAWYLPAAKNIPAGYATVGSKYDGFKAQWESYWGQEWKPGEAVFQYPNDSDAETLWYHDHSLGMTRVNVYAGPAGFYLLRGGPNDLPEGVLPGPAPKAGDPAGTRYREIPIAIQDRSFNADGSLFYPSDRAFFEGLEEDELDIPFDPEDAIGGMSDVAPIWNPEFFGNTMVVNGRTWPYLEVEQARYRFRLLNGTQGRFVILKLSNGQPFWQIGAEQGFLSEPVQLDQLLMGPAERADVIVDFSNVPVGTQVILQNIGPDEPFGGGESGDAFEPADPGTTGQVMQFRVGPAQSPDTSVAPAQLELPALAQLGEPDTVRKLSLNEADSETVFVSEDDDGTIELDEEGEPFGPTEALLGTLDGGGNPVILGWDNPITELPKLGDTEVWEIHNFTADAHPIHIHLVKHVVVNREIISADSPNYDPVTSPIGTVRGPEAWETGYKDTVTVYPGEVTRVKAFFDVAGLYVWHCHIVEHEDNEMMRPYEVLGTNPAPMSISFSDVATEHEFYDSIQYLARQGIVEGFDDGTFGLYSPVTRAHMAKMASLSFGYHTDPIDGPNDPAFTDVVYDGNSYPYDYVQEAASAGLVEGYVGGTFGPYDSLTRIQLVRVLVRASGDELAQPPAGFDHGFTDVDPADDATLNVAVFNDLVSGKTATLFAPYEVATRGHAAEILAGTLKIVE